MQQLFCCQIIEQLVIRVHHVSIYDNVHAKNLQFTYLIPE